MQYLLDEGWPPDFASRLNEEFYPDSHRSIVYHVRQLAFVSTPNGVWITALEARTRTEGEIWTVITRDRMRQHRRIMFGSPLKFAILTGDLWARARKPDLWQQLTKVWPRIHAHATLPDAKVFSVAYDGRITEYRQTE